MSAMMSQTNPSKAPDDDADITPEDLDDAARQWREDAPAELRDLIDVEPDTG